jgi:hypothetical protein
MIQQHPVASTLGLLLLTLWPAIAPAEMGPCRPDASGNLFCGEGNGAARVIPKATSPSGRLALAWRLTDRPPTTRPDDDDPALENLIVRITDGVVLAKLQGRYWDTGDRYAKGQYLFAAWSPDSRLLVRIAGVRDATDCADLFAFEEDRSVSGSLDLVKAFDPAVRSAMKAIEGADGYVFRFSYEPKLTIDNQGLIHASVWMEMRNSDGPIYKLTAQATRTADALSVKFCQSRNIADHTYRSPYTSH